MGNRGSLTGPAFEKDIDQSVIIAEKDDQTSSSRESQNKPLSLTNSGSLLVAYVVGILPFSCWISHVMQIVPIITRQ
jgi:hypothetical protein